MTTPERPVDVAGWELLEPMESMERVRALPAVTLPAAGYLVVHFAPGQNQLDFTNGSGDFYTGDPVDSPYWRVESDQAALYSPRGIVDFINWARSSVTYQPGQAHGDAAAAGIWTRGAVLAHDQIGLDRLELLGPCCQATRSAAMPRQPTPISPLTSMPMAALRDSVRRRGGKNSLWRRWPTRRIRHRRRVSGLAPEPARRRESGPYFFHERR